jgi:galactose oxidase-like protein
MQVPRANHTATLLADGRVLVVGGTSASGAATATAEIYDPAGPAWLPAGSLNVARRGQTATRLPDGKQEDQHKESSQGPRVLR